MTNQKLLNVMFALNYLHASRLLLDITKFIQVKNLLHVKFVIENLL